VRSHAGSDLAIPLDAAASGAAVVVETRAGGVQKIEVDFGTAAQGPLTGTIEAEDLTHGGTIAASSQTLVNGGTMLVIEFAPGLPDEACCRIDLAGHVTGLTGDADCLVRVLAGDVNGDGNANLIDMSAVKGKNGSNPADPAAAKFDLNVDGAINLIDMSLSKGLNGGEAACP